MSYTVILFGKEEKLWRTKSISLDLNRVARIRPFPKFFEFMI